ncbi:hypothetical protein KEM09_11305 [Carboxylicivirga mesophila]|uniref:Methylenetetrahydrofolate dehydrogenase n=1 Tax=Carboxylicivirga mesophila TaxID=1166478 RepID=A0ABS5KBT5_9BACT|nr:tetrahydrofolate dehydrogenase/cyclohydrolase catalytic domain-containing protein [Carboxylicivirga mesophila]MBS2211996.1 hypothetical protein [Carboxylicivirga mesophila]
MAAEIINGAGFQQQVFAEIQAEVSAMQRQHQPTPGIAFIAFVDHLPLMKYTIPLHTEAARALGFQVSLETCSASSGEEAMLKVIEQLNADESVHAIVLLQPVPKHINAINLIKHINSSKEVEGFHPQNILATQVHGVFGTRYPMCLPMAFFELFKYAGIKVERGQEFVFVADQDFISNPFRSLILKTASLQVIPQGCSYTLVNADNERIEDYCKRADYLFVVSEQPEFVKPEWLKKGVCIIDIYSNLVKEVASKKNPDVMIPVIRGGVSKEAVMPVAGKIAPCPGGLMPVLLAVLLRNALNACKYQLSHTSMLS